MSNVLITGASRGIGKACAEFFAENKYDLYLVCHKSAEVLRELAESLQNKYGITCKAFIGDVSNPEFAKTIFIDIPRLDMLINNAGMSYVGLFQEMTDDDYRRVMGVNLDGCFYFSREAARLMINQKNGSIINISSVWGERGGATEVVYSATKGAINAMTKALAKELAPSHISVNAIAPGIIDTDMNKCFSNEDIEQIEQEIPVGRMGRPEEVARLAYSIATSPEYLTGQIITIDGGWT
ncbi:MAG: SDR family oxidoreductase [Lachnospiraceae bacterium]|nr:SDR family oxidoreductase [Candidatus Merdinaster equi]